LPRDQNRKRDQKELRKDLNEDQPSQQETIKITVQKANLL